MRKIALLIITLCLTLTVSQVQAARGGNGNGGGGGGGSDTATVQILSSGAVLAAVECEETMDANTTSVLCNKGEEFVLDQVIVDALDGDCFSAGLKVGAVLVFINKDGTAETWFRFHEQDQAGDSILYVLEAHASSWSGTFPPEEADAPIVMESNDWLMRASNKRQAKDACLGSGDDYIQVSLDRCPTSGCP